MKKPTRDPQPTWANVKAKLACFDRMGLIGLIQDLYAADKDNQRFLHARFGLGDDVLKPYKETLDRWLWPDVLRNQDASVAKAKQAISSYRKAVGELSATLRKVVNRTDGWSGPDVFGKLGVHVVADAVAEVVAAGTYPIQPGD